MMREIQLFYFFPLTSIGGTELVHLDIVQALKDYNPEIFIRYSRNRWKGLEYYNSNEGVKSGKALYPAFRKFGKVTYLDHFIEAKRFGRIIRSLFIKQLAKRINNSVNPVIVFWHRESIEFIWPHLGEHVKIIDIVHNNSNNVNPDAKYLVNDWVTRINHRVLISEGLKKWIEPLYKEAYYPFEYFNKISVINHMVNFPKEGFLCKPKNQFNVLFVGRDASEKRFEIFLQIARKMATISKQFQFHAVGPDPNKYTDQLYNNIIWYGELNDRKQIEDLYRNAHVLLLTSSSEGFPKVIAEAMAFSCIPITTGVGGIPEVLTHRSNSILTDPEDSLVQSIAFLEELKQNCELMDELSKNAYLYSREHFSTERFQNAWKGLISTLS
jgi:glycosyltransferase involved in cell wall biosynthesis